MIRVQLPQAEADRLEEVSQSTGDRGLRDRLQIVLMAHRGRPRQEVAQDLGAHRRGVTRWPNAYCDGGLDALRPRKATGNEPKTPAEMTGEARRLVSEGPAQQGLDRASWAHEGLADYLSKAHSTQTSRSAVQRFCQKIDIRLYRPTYRYLRGDPGKQARAEEGISGLKKRRRRGRSSC